MLVLNFIKSLNVFLSAQLIQNTKISLFSVTLYNFPSIHWLNGSGFSDTTMENIFTESIQETVLQPQHQSTRSNSGDFLRPNLCRRSLFRNSYFNRIVIISNNLPSDIKSFSSIYILKANLYKYCSNKLNTVFDIDRPRAWKTLCNNCRSL